MIKIAVTADDLLGVATPTADQLDAIVSAAVGRPAVVTRWNADPVPYESGSPATGTLAQPILVGHHSENRMRRHATRIHQAMDTAVAAAEQAADTQRRAQVAVNGTDARYHPVTVANRIQRLTADRDRVTRLLNGHTRTIAVLPNGTRITDTTTPATGTHRDRLTTRLANSPTNSPTGKPSGTSRSPPAPHPGTPRPPSTPATPSGSAAAGTR